MYTNYSRSLHIVTDFCGLLLYCAVIYWLSSQPQQPVQIHFSHQDKVLHAIAFMIMAVLVWRCFRHFDIGIRSRFGFSLLFCSLYGLADEWHQSFIPGRQTDIADWLADTTGAALCLFMLYKLQKPRYSAKIDVIVDNSHK